MKKKGLLIFGSLGLVCVIVGVLLLVLSPSKSKKELYTEAISRSFGLKQDETATDEISKAVEEFEKKFNENIYKITLNGEVNNGEASHNEAEAIIYFGKNQLYVKGSSLINDKALAGELLFKDDTLYFNLKDFLKKFYYVENVSQYFKNNGETKIINKLVDYLAESFKDAIEEEEVKTDSVDLNINGSTYSTKSYGYTFTGSSLYSVLSKFIEKVKGDSEVLTELNKLLESAEIASQFGDIKLSQSDLNLLLDELLQACESVKSLGNLFTYTVYMYNDEVVSRQITVTIPSSQGNVPITIADYKINEKDKLYYKAAVTVLGMDMANIEIKQESSTKYSISVSYMQAQILTGEFIKDSNGIKLTLESSEDFPTTIKVELEMKNDGTGSLEFVFDEMEGNFEYEIETVDEIPEVDVSDSAPYTEISEEEVNKIKEFLDSIMPKQVYDLEDVELVEYDA